MVVVESKDVSKGSEIYLSSTVIYIQKRTWCNVGFIVSVLQNIKNKHCPILYSSPDIYSREGLD